MGKKILYVFLVIMLLINAMLLYMIIDKKMGKDPTKGQTFLTEQLEFSQDQKDQFFRLDRTHREKMMRMDDELRGLRKLLFRSFDSENISIDTLTMKIGDIETDKQRELFSFFSEVRNLCNDAQKEKFDKIIQEISKRRGPKPGSRKHDGPPPGPGPHGR